MATISKIGFVSHLRAEPNQFILHYRKGKLVRQGAGIAYWFMPMSGSIAMLPVEDAEATTLLSERTSDLQEVNVQVTVRYRVARPELSAKRINFAVNPKSGVWTNRPLEKLAEVFRQRVQEPARNALAGLTLAQAVKTGAERLQIAVRASLYGDTEVAELGLAVVDVHVSHVSPSAEMEKALQTPAREYLQQKADEAIFARRADAVEKERTIKENELATEIELERRNEDLIERRGANQLREVTLDGEAQQLSTEAQIERSTIKTTANAKHTRISAEADADARRMIGQANADAEAARAEAWKDLPSKVLLGLAAIEFARKVENIEHLNISPNLLGDLLTDFLEKK